MATIGASLRLYDQITDTLAKSERGIESVIAAAERLNTAAQRHIEIMVDTAQAISQVDALTNRIQNMVGTSTIKVTVGAADISQQIGQLQQQLRSSLAETAVRVTVDAGTVIQDAAQLKSRLDGVFANSSLLLQLDQSRIMDGLAGLRAQINNSASALTVQLTIDSGHALTQLGVIKQQLAAQAGTITVPVLAELDQASLQAVIAAIERQRESAGRPIQLHIDTAGALAQVDALSARIASMMNNSDIRVTVDAADLSQEIARMQQQLRGALAATAIQVTLDSGAALQEAAQLKSRLEALTSPLLVQAGLDGSKIQSDLAALRGQLAGTAMAVSIPMHIDTAQAVAQLGPLRQQLTSMIGTVQIEVMARLDRSRIMDDLAALRAQASHSAAAVALTVTIDIAKALAQVEPFKQQLAAQLGTISAELQITLPNTLEKMLVDLRRLVLQLLLAVRRIRQTLPTGAAQQLQGSLQQIAQLQQRVVQLQQQIARLQSQINSGINKTHSGNQNWLSGLKGILATYLSIAGAAKLLSATVGASMEQLKMEDMFKARTGDVQVGSAMFDKFKAEALAAGQDVNKSLQSTLSFFSTTQNTDQLSKLNNLAQRLNAFDSAGNGIEGAAFALKEAMSGDIVSLAERFNMSKTDIRAFNIDELGKAGDMEGFIKAFDQLLEKQKMGQAAFETMLASPAKQVEILNNNIKSMFANAGGDAVQALLPLINMLNTAFQAGKFQPFFDGLRAGLEAATNVATEVFGVLMQVYDFFVANWSSVEPVIWGVVGAFTAWKVATLAQAAVQAIATLASGASTIAIFAQTLATQGLAAAWGTLNAVMQVNVFILIITIIVGLIVWLVKLWQTNDKFAAALMRAWNSILNYFDQIPAYFWQMVESMMTPFGWWAKSVGKIFDAVINGIIAGINEVLKIVNKVTGSSYELSAKFSFENIGKELEGFAKAKKEDAFKKAEEKAKKREQGVKDMLNDRARKRDEENQKKAKENAGNNFNFEEWNKKAAASGTPKEIDKVKKLGKIEDKVDISSEDLKIMRDLAEMKTIQNFVTLTPTVQITTGDIRNGEDLDSMIDKIETEITKQIQASAQGTYGNG
ncbi:hypothetical protein ACFOQM_06130 [Paenibacillus sp. GCM10012307]|uniref:Uncharacterized protein n=1 Tax=Paenibacillus roseus TaxID=2798579 RepID=A0A934J4X5_9BACL|nr:hypothetical protein [Paenibacillus roseus]MBJ6360876.1 hypothetical protein [Paenibacillus roseus]